MKICRALVGFVVALLFSPHSSVARLCDKDNKSVWIMSTIGAQDGSGSRGGVGGRAWVLSLRRVIFSADDFVCRSSLNSLMCF